MNVRSLLPLLVLAAVPCRAQTELAAFGIAPGAEPLGEALAATRHAGADRVFWNNRPIPITLQVGLERQVTFPAGVRVGLDPAIRERLRTQSVDGTVHWLAYAPFETSRVQVRELRSGRTYLLDLRAVAADGDVNPIEVVDPERLADPESFHYLNTMPIEQAAGDPPWPDERGTDPDAAAFGGGPPSHDPVRLARFAFQQLYAPERLLPRLTLPGLSRVPVRARAAFLYRGGALKTTPYVSWTDGFYTVTAVKLENLTARTVLVDPRDFRGRWLARGVLHAELLARGDSYGRDQGFAVLISPTPFAEALP